MAFQYKLEYYKDDESSQDSSVFIHMKHNVPIYMNKIDKEAYEIGEFKHEWMDGIFGIGGITEASSRSYRVWVSKSPIFQWDEILPALLHYMMTYFSEDRLEEMPGSGITLENVANRRAK